jgi:hypothetical protein
MLLMGSFFDFLLRNLFVQSLGVGTLAYLTLLGIDWVIIFLLRILETFSQWYRWHASPYAFQVALGLAFLFFLWRAVFSSRQNP